MKMDLPPANPRIGITGTRNEITKKQIIETTEFLKKYLVWVDKWMPNHTTPEFHHGDCVGADVTVAEIAKSLGFKTVCHPPVDDSLRAFHDSDVILPPETYFARNRNIVNSGIDFLMVIPYTMSWQPKGGTWYTHDYAIKSSVNVVTFWPKDPEEPPADLEEFI